MKPASFLPLAILCVSLGAQTTTWTGAAGSGWNVSGNWNAGVPTLGVDAVVPAGTPNSPSTAGASGATCRDLTVNAGATLTLASGFPLDVNQNLTVAGTVAGPAALRLVGSSFGNVVGPGTVGTLLEISRTGGGMVATNGPITLGSLTLVSGAFAIGNFFGSVTTVTGNASMQGGVMQQLSTVGDLDVGGNVTFSGTAVGAAGPQVIRCGGNWTSNAAFAPVSGTIVMDGTGAQSLNIVTPLHGLTIAAGSVTTVAALTANGALAVNGSLTVSGALDANATVTVAATGALDVGGGTDSFAGDLLADGPVTASGTLVFDGTITANLTSPTPLPNVQVSKTGGGFIATNGAVTINGNLTLSSGLLVIGNFFSSVTTVNGSANLQGGALQQLSNGTLDVGGNVAFSGASVGTSPPAVIRCGGNWASDAAFAPAGGTVELDGAGATTITHATPGGTLTFGALVLKNGARSVANDFTIAAAAVTIDPGASLSVPTGRHLRINGTAPTAVNVNGALNVAANGELSLGPQTTAAVAGSLGIVGAAGQPAKITGEAGGGYALTVNGTLAAKDFLVKEMGPGGLVIGSAATIAPAPNDFRNGTLDLRAGAAAGSVLLDVQRDSPAVLDQITFLNTPGATGVFNVRTGPASLPISLVNWTGAFSGPSFEDDPNGLVTWNTQTPPVIASFAVIPGADLLEVIWHMVNETGVTGYQVRRAASAGGPFPVTHVQGPGTSNHGLIDFPLAANQQKFYLLYATLTGGETILLGSGSAAPYSSAPPPNVFKVGPVGAPFATIQSAINAATAANSVVWVTPGTYAPFSIGASAPENLHVVGDGTSIVTIDTSTGPIQISNLPANRAIELSNLVVGNASTPQNGIVVSSCAGPVILDQVDVSCDGAHTAVQVAASPKTAIQRCAIQGGTGLAVSAASSVAISRGSLSSLVSTGSTIEMTGLTPGSVSVTPPASLVSRSGIMPDVNLPELVKLSFPSALFLDAFPNAPFIIIASPKLGFTTVNPFEMPVLIDQTDLAQLPIMFTDALGQAVVGFEVTPNPVLLGFTYVVQVGAFDGSNWRFSNVETMVAMP